MSRLLAVIGLTTFFAGVVLVAHPRAAPAPVVPMTPRAAVPSAPSFPPIPDRYRIQIPRLGIDLPLAEGNVDRDAVRHQTPEWSAFHLPATGLPGSAYNCYIYAHARAGMFLGLWDARDGDEVWISTPDGDALRYVITEIHPRVPPDDVSWAAPTPGDRLTLQTSTGSGSERPAVRRRRSAGTKLSCVIRERAHGNRALAMRDVSVV